METTLQQRHEHLIRVYESRRNRCVQDLIECSRDVAEYASHSLASAQYSPDMIAFAADGAKANALPALTDALDRLTIIADRLVRLEALWHKPMGVREAEIAEMEAAINAGEKLRGGA